MTHLGVYCTTTCTVSLLFLHPCLGILYDHLYSVTTVPTPRLGVLYDHLYSVTTVSTPPPECTVRPPVQCHYCSYTPAWVYCTTTCTVSLLLLCTPPPKCPVRPPVQCHYCTFSSFAGFILSLPEVFTQGEC